MSKKKNLRLEKIVELIDSSKGEVSVDTIVQMMNISKVTIRRDLTELEKQGRLIRKFGGASSVRDFLNNRVENTWKDNAYANARENQLINLNAYQDPLYDDPVVDFEYDTKLQIAREAVELIQNNSRIIIDAGSTTGKMINYICSKEKLQIMTNSLETAYKLSKLPNSRRPKILLTGGTYDQSSDTFQGPIIQETLKMYNFEQLFIGADGIDFNRGTITVNELGNYSHDMANISQQVIVMIESSKFGRKMPKLELTWDEIDILITDSKILPEHKAKLDKLDIKVIIARNKL